jgi:DtxR family Mn-dependent transcriptional regulator
MSGLWFPLLLSLMGCGAIVLPRYGLWARWVQARALTTRFQQEDVLKHVLKCEAEGGRPTMDSIAGALEIRSSQASVLLQQLEERALVTFEGGRLRLKASGREIALHIVRAHRLWESYLAEQTGVAEREWHQRAERHEHLLTPGEADALAAKLGHPTHDPHGDEIPSPHGDLPAEKGLPLHAIPESTPVMITHIEDEPETIYAQLCAEGLRAGMRAFIIEKSAHRIRFWADGNEHILAPVLANNISAVISPEHKLEDLADEQFLSHLHPGQRGKVLGLTSACRGVERRRLLDLGFVAGTQVDVEMVSPGGDPTAYLVRGTVVALRREQANLIRVESALSS